MRYASLLNVKVVLGEILDLPPSFVQHSGVQDYQSDVNADLVVVWFLRGKRRLTSRRGGRSGLCGLRTALGSRSTKQGRNQHQHC